jgi:hypothetical protein
MKRRTLILALLAIGALLLACGSDDVEPDGAPVSGPATGNATPAPATDVPAPPEQFNECRPPSLENCFAYEQMRTYTDVVLPVVAAFFDNAYAQMPRPSEVIFVAAGETGPEACQDPNTGGQASYTSQSYEYCFVDQKIYVGQDSVWTLYRNVGDAAPAVAIAHEWGHHVQHAVGVPVPTTTQENIVHENQADCIAGAWMLYASQQQWLEYPDDIGDVDGLLQVIASAEAPGRTHGNLAERSQSLLAGYQGGLAACNAFYPGTPVIVT